MAVCFNPKSQFGTMHNATVNSLERMVWGTMQAATSYHSRPPPPQIDLPPPKRARLPTPGSSSSKSPQRPSAQPTLPDLEIDPKAVSRSLIKSSQDLLKAAGMVETLSTQAGRTYSAEHGQSAEGLRALACQYRTLTTATTTPVVSLTTPGPPSLPPSPPGSPRTLRVGPSVSPPSAAYPVSTPHTTACRGSANRDLPLSPTPLETQASSTYLDPEIGFADNTPPRRFGTLLSAVLATFTWPAIAVVGLISSIWRISHAAWNKLQHSIHGNDTTPPPHGPTAINGDPFYYAFDGRNRARALHNTNAARLRPPPARRTSQSRHPPKQLAPAIGVLLSHAASLRATEPLTYGEQLELIFADGFGIANAHAVDAAPGTAETTLPLQPFPGQAVDTAPGTAKTMRPLQPFPAHRRDCSLCGGCHLDADCETIHGPLPSNRRSCATCADRHWDLYCPFVRIYNLPRPLPFPNANNQPPATNDTSHQQTTTSLTATNIRNAAVQHILAGGSPPPSQPIAPSPPLLPPLATSTGWPAATLAAYASHNAQFADDAREPHEPAPACANDVHHSLDDNTWLAGAFANRSDAQVRIDHLRNLLDIEEVRMDELVDAIDKHHLMVQTRHHRDGLLHRLSSYIDPPGGSARPGLDVQTTWPDIPDVD